MIKWHHSILALCVFAGTTHVFAQLTAPTAPPDPKYSIQFAGRGKIYGIVGTGLNPTKFTGKAAFVTKNYNRDKSPSTTVPAAYHAATFSGGNVTDLKFFNLNFSEAFAGNPGGSIVGYSAQNDIIDAQYRAFRTQPNAALNANTDQLGVLANTCRSFATCINTAGVTGGYCTLKNATQSNFPVSWATGSLVPLQLGTAEGEVYGINASGTLVGRTTVGGINGTHKPAKWTATGTLTTISGTNGWANAINDAGRVVGAIGPAALVQAYRTKPNLPYNASTDSLAQYGKSTGLQLGASIAFAVNPTRLTPEVNYPAPVPEGTCEVVGTFKDTDGTWKAFLFSDQESIPPNPQTTPPTGVGFFPAMYDLNTLLDTTNVQGTWILREARAVSDKANVIVGWGRFTPNNGDPIEPAAFILTKLP